MDLLTDEGTWRELYGSLRSVDPLDFEHYPDRLTAAGKKAGDADALIRRDRPAGRVRRSISAS